MMSSTQQNQSSLESNATCISESVTQALIRAKEPICGRDDDDDDSEGEEAAGRIVLFASPMEMWESQGVISGTNNNSSWYNRASDYYQDNCPANLNGVLGGFASLSELDLKGSKKWLESIIQKQRPSLDFSQGAACECGAGIGRVSKGLLLPLGVRKCDLVESSSRLLGQAPTYIGETALVDRCRFYCCGLQEWTPPKHTYTIIWIQWVLCYLTDDDVVSFLKNCGEALVPGGIICLKENVTEPGTAFVLDKEDASVTRSIPYLLQLADQAGLEVISQSVQDNFPDEIFPVPMIALDVKRNQHYDNTVS